MQCSDVEQVLEQGGFSPLPDAVRGHVADCAACSSLVADFSRIVDAAHELPAEVEPPARVWISLRAQLAAEGILRETPVAQSAVPLPPSHWWQGFAQLLRGRALATAAIPVLVIAAGYIEFRRPPVNDSSAPRAVTAGVLPPQFAQTDADLDREEQNLPPLRAASPASVGSVSSVDDTLRQNLTTLNAFIKECRKRLEEDPNDPMAREYLAAAYQQKAEILAAMMERGRSVN